jgi:hypothetical protein
LQNKNKKKLEKGKEQRKGEGGKGAKRPRKKNRSHS